MSTQAISRQIIGAKLQLALLFGIDHTYDNFSTLNQHLLINESVLPQEFEYPKAQYWAIGNKGHKGAPGADGITKIVPVKHTPDHTGLFNLMPFVMRHVDDDLPPERRKDYALRKRVTKNGQDYFAYYLKRFSTANVTLDMKRKLTQNGQTDIVPYVPNNESLNPQHPVLDPNQPTPTGNEYIVSALVDIGFDNFDAREYVNVAQVLYNDASMAMISERAIVTGVDRTVTVTDNLGNPFNFKEAIGTQILQVVCQLSTISTDTQDAGMTFEVGIVESATAISI